MPADSPLFTRPFVITCLATFFFYLSFYLLLPTMPLYVAGKGGTPAQLGLVFGLFAFVAMILRPPVGWIIDTRGTHLVLLAGMAIFLVASLGYTAAGSVETILALRLFHGMGMGLFPTAATVLVAEVAPPARRGEAMGWFGIANSAGLIIGPAAGTALAARMGFPALFLSAGGMAALGLACTAILPRVGRPPEARGRAVRRRDFFSRAAILPSAILLFLYLPYGALVSFIPIIATRRGLGNPGVFYTVFALAVLMVRAKAGRLSDRRGRAAVILPGMLVAALAFAVLGLTSGPIGVLAGGGVRDRFRRRPAGAPGADHGPGPGGRAGEGHGDLLYRLGARHQRRLHRLRPAPPGRGFSGDAAGQLGHRGGRGHADAPGAPGRRPAADDLTSPVPAAGPPRRRRGRPSHLYGARRSKTVGLARVLC